MTILDYALDVSLSVEAVIKLCNKLGINKNGEDDILTDEEITLLDGEVANGDVESENDEELYNVDSDEMFEHIESLAENVKDHQVKNKKAKKIKEVKKDTFKDDKKEMYKHKEKLQTVESDNSNFIIYKDGFTVKDLADSLEVNVTEIIMKLMGLGVMANQNQSIGKDVVELIALDYQKEVKNEENLDINDFENLEIIDNADDLEERPPVVTIMGHVDHGKTSLLDAIRESNVASGEAGGITQAIGAYQVEVNGKKITFIDTPGHEAFTEMRARGASVTDIVIIIVAADDGVMPQTKEAIDHAKAANVPILVAINKIDKPGSDPDRVLQELSQYGIIPEEWGGDTIVTKISAKTHQGIDELLDNILLVSEMKELKANPKRYALGTVIESRLDKQVGVVATVLVQNGTLRLGDPVVVGTSFGKIRTLKNDLGKDVLNALPSTPVEITGLSNVPEAGDKFMAFETEKQAKQVANERTLRVKEKDSNFSGMTLEDLFGKVKEGLKEIKVIIKADVNGSSEAVKQSLEKIDVEDVKINVIRSSVGAISESDIVLAKASQAIIIGFNVKATNKVVEYAKDNGVEVRYYDIIYKLVEDMESAMKGMLEPLFEEKTVGTLEIRQIFKFSKVGNIAGCHVLDGTIKNNSKARLIRDGIVVYTGSIKSIQREKDQVKEVSKGMDCGVTLENYQDIKENDIIESYEEVEIKR